GLDAGDRVGVGEALVDLVERLADQLVNGLEGHAPLLRREVEDALLGEVQHVLDGEGLVVRLLHDAAAGGDEVTQRGLLYDDAYVAIRERRGRYLVGEADQVVDAADALELTGGPQLLGKRDEIDGVALAVEALHRPEDLAVGLLVEVLRSEHALEARVDLVVQHDAAQNAHLGFQAVRGRPAVHVRHANTGPGT